MPRARAVANRKPAKGGAGFALFAERTSDVIVRVDSAGRVTYASPAIRNYGYQPEDVIGLTGAELIHPEDAPKFAANVAALIRGERDDEANRENRFRCADGSWTWMEGNPHLEFDDDGQVCGFVNIFRDITRRRAAEAALAESEARYRLIAENMRDLVICAEIGAGVTYVSPSVRLYGYEPEELIGRRIDELVHPDDLPRVHANRLALLSGDSGSALDWHVRYRTGDGGWVWLEGNPRAIRDASGRVTGAINILRDVTERRAEADQFETAFQQAAIGKALVAIGGQVLKVNGALRAALGYTEEELLARTVGDLAHPEEIGRFEAEHRRLLAGEVESHEVERRFRRADGSYIWAGVTVAVVRNPDGSPKHYVTEVQDLTERHAVAAALAESEARYRLIAENMSDMIFVADLDRRSTYVSPSVRRYGVEPEDIVGLDPAASVHPDDLPRMRAAFEGLLRGEESGRLRWRGRYRSTGGWDWLESSPTLLRDPETGVATGFLDVVRDVGLQVEQEEALAQARADAEAATAAKAQFLANMSHEIRTPLTAVLGFAGLLRDDATVQGAAAGYVSRIQGAGNGLLAIVNDVLDFSKLEAGKFEIRPRPCDVGAICEETVTIYTAQAAAKGLRLGLEAADDLPGRVMIDGDRLRQMLINLVGNAIKFTEAGDVTLRAAPGVATDMLRFEVVDSGPGLDEDAQALLFQRFTQIDGSTTRRHGGTGLGLAICRGLAEAMGGSIGVTSKPGEGATFHLDLPAAKVDLPDEGEAAAPIASIEGARVCLVDDNPANRELGRRILEVAGAEVIEAGDGLEALELLALQPVDVVLMDLRMPGLDGRGALARLRETAGPNQHTPVLAFTADADLAGAGDLAGFDGLVRKPIQPLDMYTAIAAATQWAPQEYEDDHNATG